MDLRQDKNLLHPAGDQELHGVVEHGLVDQGEQHLRLLRGNGTHFQLGGGKGAWAG